MSLAQMAELVDALVSGTSLRKVMGVRVPLWALNSAFSGFFFKKIKSISNLFLHQNRKQLC